VWYDHLAVDKVIVIMTVNRRAVLMFHMEKFRHKFTFPKDVEVREQYHVEI
jgi:hypothetical protein